MDGSILPVVVMIGVTLLICVVGALIWSLRQTGALGGDRRREDLPRD